MNLNKHWSVSRLQVTFVTVSELQNVSGQVHDPHLAAVSAVCVCK